jgi:beta-mannosidase
VTGAGCAQPRFILDSGWELACSEPNRWAGPDEARREASWQVAHVPGTAAAAVGADPSRDFDAEDWWFRVEFPVARTWPGRRVLRLGGIATVSEVFLNGDRLLESRSMWRAHELDVTDRLADHNELMIACRALKPRLARRRRPSARWRTRVVEPGNLRWFRTMMFGRSPGFAPGPAAVGPWRPVELRALDPRDPRDLQIRTAVDAQGTGTVRVRLALPEAGPDVGVELRMGEQVARLTGDGAGGWRGEIRAPGVELWWPHTHGRPVLHSVTLVVDGTIRAERLVGFRTLTWSPDIRRDGLDLRINGIALFARGAVWTPFDLVGMAPSRGQLKEVLERVRDGGMNMLRVVGTGAYESAAFHDLCDELGILVWQDLMFANVDYPLGDPEFAAEVHSEAREVLGELIGRPSLAVICGNSEIEQQAAMLGLEPDLGRHPFWDETLPALVAELEADCAYVPSTPCGGVIPFQPDRGIAHYFGVSGYFGAVQDARRAQVRFAAECLAFANVPDQVTVPVHHPRWKAGVVRDAGTGWDIGAGWDFDDVRDHYLRALFDVDPVALRRSDHGRYLELSRFASAEVMAEVIGEWRRAESPCRGALVLWLKDMLPGAGLGVLDHFGAPKVAYHHLRRAFAPLAVWCSDEGLSGVAIHVANDGLARGPANLRVALYRDFEETVEESVHAVDLAAHTTFSLGVEEVLGRFVDAAWSYRFGPPAQDLITIRLEGPDGSLLADTFHLPADRPIAPRRAGELGLRAEIEHPRADAPVCRISATRFTYGIRLAIPGFVPADNAFSLAPGASRAIILTRAGAVDAPAGTLTALNLRDELSVQAA